MDKVRLGIIGTGIAAKKLHYPALGKLGDKYEITCVCNHTEPKAKEFSAMAGGVDYVLDYKELLARDDVDAVDIILPIDLNFQAVTDSLNAGKHVIVEKPLGASLEEVRRMTEYQNQYPDLKMMVAENYRYDSGLLKIKELIENGALGRVYSADWNVYLFMGADSRYRHIKWRVEHKYPGGFVMDAGIHNIAGLRMLFGELDIRAAQSLCIEPGLGRVDTLMMMFETDSGVKGTFNDYFRSNGYYENRLVVFGTDGTIVFNRDRSGETVVVQGREIPRREFKFEHSESYKNEFEDFYNAVVKDKRPKSSFEEGAKDFETMLGALKLAGAD